MLLIIFASVMMLGISIFIHELGHLLCGIFVGVKARIFSIGYGKGVWRKRIGETIYQITALPIGGYVMFKGDQYGRGLKGKQGELLSTPPLKRMIPVLGGPFFNLILGFGIFFMLAVLGDKPISSKIFIDKSTKEYSAAYMAGLRTGDKILSINDSKVESFEDIFVNVGLSGGEKILVEYERNGETLKAEIIPDVYSEGGRPSIGIEPFGQRNLVASFTYSEQFRHWLNSLIDTENKSEEYFKKNFPDVKQKTENFKTRAISFLNDGDMILEVEGKKVSTVFELQTLLGEYQNKEVSIKVQRRTIPLLTPLASEEKMIQAPVKAASIIRFKNLEEKNFKSLSLKNFQLNSHDPGIETKIRRIKINDKTFKSYEEVYSFMESIDETNVNLIINKNEYKTEFNLKKIGLLGFMADTKFEPEKVEKDISVKEAIFIASSKVYKSVETSFKGLGLIFKGLISVKDSLSGPVGIVHLAGSSIEYGWFTYWNFVANISIALMFMNLLPIPVADGGHLVLYLFEAISGKPLPPKVIDMIFKIGFVFLLLLGVMVTYYDFTRYFQ